MKITRRRTVAGLAAASLALTLAACSTDDGDGDGDGADAVAEDSQVGAMDDYDVGTTFVASEPVELSLLYRDHPNYPLDEDWLFFSALEERNNVTFDLVSAPLSDWDDRKSLLIGAGDAPDILPVTYPGQEVPFVAGRAILPVSDYLDYLPNFTQKVEEWGLQDAVDNLRQEDGKFYLLPGLHESVRPQYTYAVRTDIWEELGLSLEPATFEEFAEQLATRPGGHP